MTTGFPMGCWTRAGLRGDGGTTLNVLKATKLHTFKMVNFVFCEFYLNKKQ